MCTLIMTYQLHGLDAAKSSDLAHHLATELTPAAGLAHRTRLEDQGSGTYGGVFAFANRRAVDVYLGSEAVAMLRSQPNVRNLSCQMFVGVETPADIRPGYLVVVPDRIQNPGTRQQPAPSGPVSSNRRFVWRSHDTGPVAVS